MGKGDRPRPKSTTREEEDLRNDYAYGKISLATFDQRYEQLRRKGLLRRNGRVLK